MTEKELIEAARENWCNPQTGVWYEGDQSDAIVHGLVLALDARIAAEDAA